MKHQKQTNNSYSYSCSYSYSYSYSYTTSYGNSYSYTTTMLLNCTTLSGGCVDRCPPSTFCCICAVLNWLNLSR